MAEPAKRDPKAPVPVVTPTGKVGYLPPELAEDAALQGVRGASDRELRGAQAEANASAEADAARHEFEGAGVGGAIEGTLGPELAGFARGASIGTSDEALLGAAESLGGPDAREALRKRLLSYQSYAPVRSFTSELGGAIAASAVGDEAAGGRVAAKLPQVLARGAGEGAIFGAGGAASEASLRDERLTGEALIGGAAHGALGGMLISGAFHGLGRGVAGIRGPSGTPAAYDALAARTFGEAAPGVGREAAALEKAETKLHMPEAGPYRGKPSAFDVPAEAAIRVGARGDEAKLAELGEIWKHREVTLNEGAERLDNHARAFTDAVTEQQKAARVTDMATFGDAKKNHMAGLVDRSQFGDQAKLARGWMDEASGRLAGMVGDPNSGLTKAAVQRMDGHFQRILTAIETGDSAKLNGALDDAKRFLGREAQYGRTPYGKSEAARAFDELYQGADGNGGLRTVLENDAWGERAANAQRIVNATTHDWIGTGERFRDKFTTKYGDTMGVPNFVGNSESVSSFMSRLTKASNDLDARAVRDAIQARRSFLDATEKSYDHGGAARDAITKERAALNQMEATFDRATKEASLINQTKRLQSEEQAQRVGGLLGLATDTFTKPVTTLQRLAQLEGHTEAVVQKLRGDTGSLLGKATKVETPTFGPPKGKGQGFFSSMLDDTPSMGGAAGAAEGKRGRYERRMEALASIQANPAQVADRLGNAMAPFATAAPRATANAQATAMAGLSFLASKMPPSRRDPYSLQPQLEKQFRTSDAEAAQFMRYAQAVDDPLIVLREAKSGTLSRDHVEAVKAVYPRLYDEMRAQVMKTLIDSKSPLPYSQRIQLGILLDIPTDKTLSPDFLTAIQATYSSDEKAGAESPPPTLSRPINVAAPAQTAMQQAAGRVQ